MSERTHDRAMLAGVGVCGLAVAAYSSWAQFSIASAAGYPVALAWVVPVATDATAALGTRAWMSPHYGDKVRNYGCLLAISAIALSFLTAALHLVIPTDAPGVPTDAPGVPTGVPIPWQIRLAIGGLPSLALAALVHLGALTAKDKPRARTAAKVKPSRRSTASTSAQTPTTELSSGVDQVATPEDAMNLSTSGEPSTPSSPGNGIRARMFTHLDQHPEATGAELDTQFGTRNYGRKVRRDWENARRTLRLVDQAIGE